MITRAPGEVLDAQTRLAEGLLKPSADLMAFTVGFMRDAWAKSHAANEKMYSSGRARGMFYPLIPPRGRLFDEGHARELNRLLGVGVRDAVCYQVTAEMVRVMRDTYTGTMRRIEHIDEPEMPVPAGWAWLDEPWVMTDTHGLGVPVRVVSWHATEAMTTGSERDPLPSPQVVPCFRVMLWTHVQDDIDAGRLSPDEEWLDIGALSLMHTAVVPFGLRFQVPDAEARKGVDSFLGLVHLLWMFLGMEITATPRAHLPRPFRRRAQRSLKHGEVHVVLLRRIAHVTEPPEGHTRIDWTCRWVVQGHYRHIEPPEGHRPHRGFPVGADRHCGVCGGRLTWVGPYLKGPDGKPLKVSRTLMKLAR